ncbi:MAG: DEAD/DEAH box helicase [Phycisphaerales bacterium]
MTEEQATDAHESNDSGEAQTNNTTENASETTGDGGEKKKRRRRRRRKPAAEGTAAESPATEESAGAHSSDEPREESDRPRKKRRRKSAPEISAEEAADREAANREPTPRRIATKPEEGWSEESFQLDKTFKDLGLKQSILDTVGELGFEHPTKIQAEMVPLALTGKDILGQAKTGTGKTASFALPLLHMVTPGEECSAIIVAPTRELAVQIKQDFDQLGGKTGLSALTIYGGQSIKTQADRLAKGPEIIVGTPGRIIDMAERGYLRLHNVKFAVLDEVDRMFDIGFRDDIKRILKMCPEDRQTIFVSATMTPEIESLARRYMHKPEKLVVSSGSLTVELVKQGYVTVDPWDKKRMLAHLLTNEEPALTIVFCRMKRTVDDVVRYLSRKNITAHAIHGDMSQGKRNTVMTDFRGGKLAVLVASDLASRGIDVEGITHVVNYDLPEDPDNYVHRIGRTARAGRGGHAWSLVTPAQGPLLTDIEMLVNTEIPRMDYPDFEARERPDDWRDEPTGGRPVYEVKGVTKETKNRFEVEAPPKAEELSDAQKAAKFPGGVVPSKMPPKLMRGKAKTRGR